MADNKKYGKDWVREKFLNYGERHHVGTRNYVSTVEGKTKAQYLRGRLSKSQKALFSVGTVNRGHVVSPFKEMTLGKSFGNTKHANVSASTKYFQDFRTMKVNAPDGHGVLHGKTTKKWGTFDKSKNPLIKISIRQMPLTLYIASTQMGVAWEHWKYALILRALKVFQDSFRLKRFNSDGEPRWKPLSPWTIKKRMKRGVWPGAKYKKKWVDNGAPKWPGVNKELQYTNKLYESLRVSGSLKNKGYSVIANAPYSGIHNDPPKGAVYGNGFKSKNFMGFRPVKKVVQRKFMGHSTLIDEFMASYESSYTFDTIFRRPE